MFKVGDRVRYLGDVMDGIYKGESVVITKSDDTDVLPYEVYFNSDFRQWVDECEIETFVKTFKVGDVVKVSDSNMDAYGYITTVYSDSCRVRINEHTEWGCDNSELTHSDKNFTKNFTFNQISGKVTLCD